MRIEYLHSLFFVLYRNTSHRPEKCLELTFSFAILIIRWPIWQYFSLKEFVDSCKAAFVYSAKLCYKYSKSKRCQIQLKKVMAIWYRALKLIFNLTIRKVCCINDQLCQPALVWRCQLGVDSSAAAWRAVCRLKLCCTKLEPKMGRQQTSIFHLSFRCFVMSWWEMTPSFQEVNPYENVLTIRTRDERSKIQLQ